MPPTRMYPSTRATATLIHGPVDGSWGVMGAFGRTWIPVQPTWRLSPVNTDCGPRTNQTMRTNQDGYDFNLARWMTPPLTAQTISGTLQGCIHVLAKYVDSVLGTTTGTTAKVKVHAYITQGESCVVRHVLINNYINTNALPTGSQTWRTTDLMPITSASANDGDCIMIEVGISIISSPDPQLPIAYPPDDYSELQVRAYGTVSTDADAANGDSTISRNPWWEFSNGITLASAPAAPANDACVDAITIPSLPYESPFIVTTTSADTNKAVWWQWTAPADGTVIFHTHGSNYSARVDVMTGTCGSLSNVSAVSSSLSYSAPRSQAYTTFDAINGTTYFIRVQHQGSISGSAANTGGVCRLSGVYRAVPAEDDLFIPIGSLVSMRDGVLTNINGDINSLGLTGISVDYSLAPLDNLNGGVHTGERLYIGSHGFSLVEIYDIQTFNVSEAEIDFIADPFLGIAKHPSTLYLKRDGTLYTGFFGDGYLFVAGTGTLPSFLNDISSDPSASAIRVIAASHADHQAGNPFTATTISPSIEKTGPWSIAVDEDAGILYYVSSGYYIPVGGQIIKRWNLNTNSQMADFATIPLQGANNPGLKGMQVIPGGNGLLVCNGTVVHRLNAVGTIITTYTPSIAQDSQSLASVCLTADSSEFWVIDEPSSRLYKFNLESGAETFTIQPYFQDSIVTQMAIYQPSGIIPPPPPPEPVEACTPDFPIGTATARPGCTISI